MRLSATWLSGALRSPRRAALLLAAIAASLTLAGQARAATVVALTTDDRLLRLDSAAPGTVLAAVPVSGLAAGEQLQAIDVRPLDGRLYGLGSQSRLYVINTATGAATQIGPGPVSPALAGTAFGFDFNPKEDRIRVVSDAGENLRLNLADASAAPDNALNPGAPRIVGSAYTHSFAGATATTLYGIDSAADQLVAQNPANNGHIAPIGPLGVDTDDLVGFDIDPNGDGAYASLTTGAASGLYRIDLATGAAAPLGTIGGGSTIRGIALLSHPVTVYGVTALNRLVRFSSATPGITDAITPIGGLMPGEEILALDVRPAGGGLYALGLRSGAGIPTARLLALDPLTAAATPVGGDVALTAGVTAVGLDVDPVTERATVVSDAGDHLWIDPVTGAVTALGHVTASVGATAYTNSLPGATSTTLFGIDHLADTLVTIADDGTVSPVGPLGVDTTSASGMDIAGADGTTLASLVVAGTPGLYLIDRATGAATLIAAIAAPGLVRAIAIAPPGRPAFAAESTAVAEGSGGVDVVVNRLEGSDGPLSVDFSATAGTATAGADFAPMSATITFLAGETSKVVRVPIIDDALVEGEETVNLALSNSTSGAIAPPSSAVLRIVSEDAPITPPAPSPTRQQAAKPGCPGMDVGKRHVVRGTSGNDRLRGTPGPDLICGMRGDDLIIGLGGDDVLLGGPGQDTIEGGPGRDRLFGEGGADTLRGGAGTDVLLGGAGTDRLIGGAGPDVLEGGPDRDLLEALGGLHDFVRGGSGLDRGIVDAKDQTSSVERLTTIGLVVSPKPGTPAHP
jgi:Ca2+-binding RTX toxin-like protein